MDLSSSDLVGIFDRLGIVAFAFSGVEVGVRKRLDILGLLVMGVVTATGGGVMRDILLNRPPLVLVQEDYFLLAIGASLLAVSLVSRRSKPLRTMVTVLSAIGIGAFAAAGAVATLATGYPLPAVIALAMLTATGGGAVRDLLADEVPAVLRAELNATAAGVGGFLVWAFDGIDRGPAALLGALVATGLNLFAVFFRINLPIPGRGGPSE